MKISINSCAYEASTQGAELRQHEVEAVEEQGEIAAAPLSLDERLKSLAEPIRCLLKIESACKPQAFLTMGKLNAYRQQQDLCLAEDEETKIMNAAFSDAESYRQLMRLTLDKLGEQATVERIFSCCTPLQREAVKMAFWVLGCVDTATYLTDVPVLVPVRTGHEGASQSAVMALRATTATPSFRGQSMRKLISSGKKQQGELLTTPLAQLTNLQRYVAIGAFAKSLQTGAKHAAMRPETQIRRSYQQQALSQANDKPSYTRHT